MKKIYDIIIIGGGTAGMTAAIYGYRRGKEILIIEKSIYGGQIVSTPEIENYPGFATASGYDFASKLYEQINHMSIAQVSDEVIGINKNNCLWHSNGKRFREVFCRKDSYLAKAIIIATGTKNRELGLSGEMDYLGHGLSYCATCDGAFYKNKTTAVVGGGNTALEEALYLSLLCNMVYLIHRGDELTGNKSLQKRIEDSENINVLLNTRVLGLHGEPTLEKIEISDSRVLHINGLFVAIGHIPQNKPFAHAVNLDKDGYIIAGENCHTSAEGIFAAGDCRTKALRQLVTAAADGAAAATEASK